MGLLKIDIGCGSNKRAGFVGLDRVDLPGVDHCCDFTTQPLPFADCSVDQIFSSHCLEHVPRPSLVGLFQEMTRVAADGCQVEIWHPHASHADALVLGHITYLGDAIYDHIACLFREHWAKRFGAQWILQEIRYGVDRLVLDKLAATATDIDFAVTHLRNVIREIGVFVHIDRSDAARPLEYRRTICERPHRDTPLCELPNGPRGI